MAGLGVQPEAGGCAQTQEVFGEPVVVAAALADLTAAIHDGASDAVHRAAAELIGEVGLGERRVPGGGEARRIGPRAQAIGGLPAHADRAACRRDAAALGQRGDEGGLPRGRPTRPAGHGRERG